MKPSDAHPGRVFEWKSPLAWSGIVYETVYVVLDKWSSRAEGKDPQLRVLVLHSTYPTHTSPKVMTLRTDDRMWMEATRIA